jgi:hypothetical protein
MTAVVVGLVSIAVIWLVVIYGSIYVNKNVQETVARAVPW